MKTFRATCLKPITTNYGSQSADLDDLDCGASLFFVSTRGSLVAWRAETGTLDANENVVELHWSHLLTIA